MKILEITTGLFPDSTTVIAGVETLRGTNEIEQRDVTGLAPEDEIAWGDVARAILAADLVVTV